MDNLEDLEQQLDQAIENCDFEYAQQIKDQIDERKLNENHETVNQYIQSFRQLTEECKANLEDEMNSLDESIGNQEILIRRKVSNIFHELQVKHVEVLLHTEKENLLKFAKEQFRVIPEVYEIREQAKLAAYNLQYETAILMKERSDEVEEEELQKRQENVTNQFYSRRSVVLQKQKEEMKALTNQLNIALYNLQKRKQFEIDKIYQGYRKNLKESYDNITLFIKTIKNKDFRKECQDVCREIYKEKMSEAVPSDDKQKYFGQKSTSPSRPQSQLSPSRTQSQSSYSRPQSQLSASKISNSSKDLQVASISPTAATPNSTSSQKKLSSPSKINRSQIPSKSPSSNQQIPSPSPAPNQQAPSASSKPSKSHIPTKVNSSKPLKSTPPNSPKSSKQVKSATPKSSKTLNTNSPRRLKK